MDLVLGIDTGGTFTDGVLLDYATKEVAATAKALTTRYDLTVGILNAIDALPIADPRAIKLVSISTTLATNAIAEGKGKRVALFLIGYDEELVRAYSFARRFATPRYYYFPGGHDVFGQEKQPLDVEAIAARKSNALSICSGMEYLMMPRCESTTPETPTPTPKSGTPVRLSSSRTRVVTSQNTSERFRPESWISSNLE